MIDETLLARLAKLDSCAVSDAFDQAGHQGVALGLTPLAATRRVVGRAVTVDLGPDEGGPRGRHLGTAAVEACGPESVILVSHDARTDVAGWGGILSLGASLRGAAGVFVDGACRDIDEARALDLPVYARCAVPRTARGRIVERDWNIPIEFCGIAVSAGDYVIADGSGVAIIPQDVAEAVVEAAERVAAKETAMAAAIRRGDPISRVMGVHYETMLLGAGDDG